MTNRIPMYKRNLLQRICSPSTFRIAFIHLPFHRVGVNSIADLFQRAFFSDDVVLETRLPGEILDTFLAYKPGDSGFR